MPALIDPLTVPRHAAADLISMAKASLRSLAKQSRPTEPIVQAFLFFCGALSIFVAVGIVVVFGCESLTFATSDEVNLWQYS